MLKNQKMVKKVSKINKNNMDTQQIIKERINELPDDIRTAIASTNLASKFDSIANKHNLHIDQNGALQTETLLVMIGLESTDDFLENVRKALEISSDEAYNIAKDVNTEILDNVRDSLRKIQSQAESESQNQTPVEEEVAAVEPTLNKEETVASIEHAGDFKIENTQPQSSSPQYKETDINREALLKGIEDAPVPLVDHLLTTPISNEKVVEVKDVTDTKADALDPYREKI